MNFGWMSGRCSHPIIVHPAQLASGDETPVLLVYLESTLSLGCNPILHLSGDLGDAPPLGRAGVVSGLEGVNGLMSGSVEAGRVIEV